MPKENEYSLENTDKLREFEETILIKMSDNKETAPKTENHKQKTAGEIKTLAENTVKKPEIEQNKDKSSNIPEQITDHYKNLNQALNDFFSSEEGEEESENEESTEKNK